MRALYQQKSDSGNVALCLQDAVLYSQRTINEENGNYWPVYSWDLSYYGTQVKLAQLTGNSTFASEVSWQGPCCFAHVSTHLQMHVPAALASN